MQKGIKKCRIIRLVSFVTCFLSDRYNLNVSICLETDNSSYLAPQNMLLRYATI